MSATLVTGGTGFVGKYVIGKLLEAGRPVRALVRDPLRLDPAHRPRVGIRLGDVCDPAAVEDAVVGADTVIHLAALARAWAPRGPGFRAVNAEAVAGLLRACRRHGVRRVVHVSTVLTLPPARPAPRCGLPDRPTPYQTSKREAEALVRAYVAAGGDAVVVRPSRVYGPGPSNDANGATQLIDLYLRGRFRFRPADGDVQSNWVHAEDVAEGILLAAERGRAGRAYQLGGENASLRRYLELAGEIAGVAPRVLPVPPSLLAPAAWGCALWGRLGGTPSLTPEWLRLFLEDRPIDLEAERRELGYVPRPLAEGLRQTIAWLNGGGNDERPAAA